MNGVVNVNTFVANLKYAVRNKENVVVGGGEFPSSELKEVVLALETAQVLQDALEGVVEAWTEQFERQGHLAPVWVKKARAAIRKSKGDE